MSKSEEHEAGKRSAIGARIVRMKVKSNRNKNTKNKNEEQQEQEHYEHQERKRKTTRIRTLGTPGARVKNNNIFWYNGIFLSPCPVLNVFT